MRTPRWIPALFLAAALYDGLLGLVFLFFPLAPFAWFEATPPNHPGYLQFPALLLIVFGFMFLQVAQDPLKGRILIPYGILLKAAYVGVVGWYWATENLPGFWKPFVVADTVMGGGFLLAYFALKSRPAREGDSPS